MVERVQNFDFDTRIYPSDWRYSATIVGLEKYLDYQNLDYEVTDDYLAFNEDEITLERFLEFAENYYDEEFPHRKLEVRLGKEEFSEEEKKIINDLLKSNSIMKKVFGKTKFDGTNKLQILNMVEQNRNDLIRETFRNKSNMYANFANTTLLFEEGRECCRLLGYYVDGNRKSKNLSFGFRTENFVSEDCLFFDFIPFAFYGEYEAFFINDNYSVKRLIRTSWQFAYKLKEEAEPSLGKYPNARKILFKSIQESADFIDYDVEVILKDRNRDFFETLFIRKESIEILRKFETYTPFCFSLQINKNYYLDMQKATLDCILNLRCADELIELCLKRDNLNYLTFLLIKLNVLIKEGGSRMNKGMNSAYACAKRVIEKLPENKRKSYRQKLTSALVLKDYETFIDILSKLSNYVDVSFSFIYDLLEDFEKNKEIAYTFVNAMAKETSNEEKDNRRDTK